MQNNNRNLCNKVIFVTTDEEATGFSRFHKDKTTDPQLSVISVNQVPALRKQVTYLPDVSVGEMLVLNPYEPGTYTLLDSHEAIKDIRNSKFCLIREIAQLLGAEGCTFSSCLKSNYQCKWTTDGNITYDDNKVTHDFKNDTELRQEFNLAVENQWIGAPLSQETYQAAKSMAIEYRLWNINEVRSLIRMRDPSRKNLLLEEQFHFDLSSEVNKLLDAALSINALGGILDINQSLNRIMSQRENVTIDLKFKFPNNIIEI